MLDHEGNVKPGPTSKECGGTRHHWRWNSAPLSIWFWYTRIGRSRSERVPRIKVFATRAERRVKT